MDVQTDVRHVVQVLAGNKPDDLADLAFGIIAGHASKSERVYLLILGQLGACFSGLQAARVGCPWLCGQVCDWPQKRALDEPQT
jgi:hypothetical protein